MKVPLDIGPVADGLRSIGETMRTIRDSVALLPAVAETLGRIEEGVRFMGDEVHTMRKGVDSLGVEVRGMRESVEPIVAHLDIVAARIERLEPKLDEVSLAIHPLRRATGRLSRRNSVAAADQTDSGENVSQADGSPSE